MSLRQVRLVALSVAGLAAIGLVDAAIIDEPDLVVLFAGIAALAATWFASTLGSRRRIMIRSDLAGWLQRRADLTGEAPEAIADRALAMFRIQLGESSGDTEAPGTPSQQAWRAP